MIRTALLAALLLAPASRAAEGDFTKEELGSLYYADLGPDSIEVSDYPKRQRRNHEVFVSACSQCHTLARAVNSPTVSEAAWEYYVFRMRLRGKFSPGTGFTPEQGRAVVDFLAYDSHRRKVKDRESFDALTRKLQRRFSETIEERMRRLQKASPRVRP